MKTAIYGIGNILLGDDGVGPAVVEYLAAHYTFGPEVILEDLGTPPSTSRPTSPATTA